MEPVNPKLIKLVTWFAGIAAVVVAIILPLGYFTLSYQNQAAALDVEAEINGRLASQVVNANPEMWRFQQLKLEEFLKRRPRHGHKEVRRILDNSNRVVAESADPLEPPLLTGSVDILDAGVRVGHIEISRSLRPLLLSTTGVLVFSSLLGSALFLMLRTIPLRLLSRALADNARFLADLNLAKENLERANITLTVQAAELARSNEEVQARYQELQGLHAISQTILGSLDVKAMLKEILDSACVIGGFDVGLIRILDPTGKTLEAIAMRGYRDPKNVEDHRKTIDGFTTGSGTAGTISDKAVHVVDLSQTTAMRTFKKEGVRTAVVVPLRSQDNVLGNIHLGNRSERTFEQGELQILEAIGGQTGIAIQKARLYDEAKQAHAALAAKADELVRSNTELQHFAYIASHDLQEPLRMVASYVQLLARRYKGKLDNEANEFIDFAVDGATRMQALINALLAYSRIGTKAKTLEPTDCEKVLEVALKDLHLAVEESKAIVTHDPLPTVMGDATQLGQLFQNLIGNSVKFRGGETPRIHISAERNGKDWYFSHRDNGIGIDPQFSERIFVIFQRLHSKQEYPGTGIGLALCKKIVERHGGRIWMESEPGHGTIFRFTIPLLNISKEEIIEHAPAKQFG
jgi:signal transduction histidine kinase